MEREFWTVGEIVEIFSIQEDFIHTLEREGVITLCSDDKGTPDLLQSSDLEKVLVAKTLIEDLDVNLPGVEVILGMRQSMFEMRCQFDEILKTLVEEFRKLLGIMGQGRQAS